MDALRQLVDAYRAKTGRVPTDFRELVAAGMLTGIPVDPTGVPYVLDPAAGEVLTSPETKLGFLPTQSPR
jgi:hypothetical protein